MVVLWVELFQQGNAAPTTAEYNKPGLVLVPFSFVALVIIQHGFNDGEVLGTASGRVQSSSGDITVAKRDRLLVSGSIVYKEGSEEKPDKADTCA